MRVALTTLGCKVNQYDAAVMDRLFAERGWQRVAFAEHADAYVVNTCTVTDRADRDARRLARRARRTNPAARVILTGCYAQTSPAKIDRLGYVDYVIGLGRLPDLLGAVAGELERRVAVSDLRHASQIATVGIRTFPGRTRAFVKVQEGCNLFCTFCIIPVARGRSRSVATRRVVEEIEGLAAGGYREVVLTGVHLGSYGADLEPPCGLPFLLEAILERNLGLRVRISSIDPPELSPRLIEVMAANPALCRHLHVPLQAGDDGVLSRMGRRYTTRQAAERLAALRRAIPDVSIGTDLITGFPGESEQEYARTLAYIEALKLSYLHVFPYSRRSSTSAAKRWPALPDRLVHERARRLRQLDRRLRERFASRFLGARLSVLFETLKGARRHRFKGYSSNYIPVLCSGAGIARNQIHEVLVTGRTGALLLARPL